MKSISIQASHGFLAWGRTCGADKVFAVQTNASKVARQALPGIFSGSRESKTEIPAQ